MITLKTLMSNPIVPESVQKLSMLMLLRKKYSALEELRILKGECSPEERVKYDEYVSQCEAKLHRN